VVLLKQHLANVYIAAEVISPFMILAVLDLLTYMHASEENEEMNLKSNKMLYFTYLPRRGHWMDFHQFWQVGSAH